MAEIEKKAWPELFEKVLDGSKRFDMRLADININKGDTLVLKEWDPKTKEYTGRELRKIVGYVLKFKPDELIYWWPKEDIDKHGLQIISLD